MPHTYSPELLLLDRRYWMPNNPRLPVLIYRRVREISGAASIEAMFERNGWPAQWRGQIFDFHHYHTNTHEVLGVASGSAQLMLGGPDGVDVTVRTGDVLVLPAGTGHCRLGNTEDFLVVGGYPPGHTFDLWREAATESAAARMGSLPLPAADPVEGDGGPLIELWR